MATLTSRLKLLKPDRLELVNVLNHLNANLDRLDSGGNGAYRCTSSTRPNGVNFPLFDGMLIYEEDTGHMLQYRDSLKLFMYVSSMQGWQDLIPGPGYTAGSGSFAPSVRREGRLGYIRGQLIKNTGAAAGDVVATIPPNQNLRAEISVRLLCSSNLAEPNAGIRVTVQGNGEIVLPNAITGAHQIFFAHTYPLLTGTS